jgi:hypothetical protein
VGSRVALGPLLGQTPVRAGCIGHTLGQGTPILWGLSLDGAEYQTIEPSGQNLLYTPPPVPVLCTLATTTTTTILTTCILCLFCLHPFLLLEPRTSKHPSNTLGLLHCKAHGLRYNKPSWYFHSRYHSWCIMYDSSNHCSPVAGGSIYFLMTL